MKKWGFSGILALILLLGSLVLLGCFFAAELFPALANMQTEPSQTISSSTSDTTIEESSGEDTITEDTTSEALSTEGTSGKEETSYTISASHAFVYNPASDHCPYTRGGMNQQIAPASVTKLLTAYVGLQHLSPNTVLTAGSALSLVNPGSSVAGLSDGYRLTVEMCIQAMMMPSGNDAAHVLAVAVGRKIGGTGLSAQAALNTFMEEVNRVASQLGMTGTHFVNPDGMDSNGHYSTPRDLLILTKVALQNKIIMKYAGMYYQNLTITSGQTLSLKNSNLLLDPNSKYYTPSVCGLKTGTTSKAGACLVSIFQKDGKTIIIGVFGCPTDDARYEDTLNLYKTYG